MMYSVAAILYKYGFGFDAFIHRATEVWIQTHGFILPKTPYYIGQYSFVVWLSNLTRIPIFYIDVYLVPVLAALTLPATIILSLKRAWDVPYEKSALALWLIPFVPFLSFHLTTPYNLALLFTILCVFTLLPVLVKADSHKLTAISYHNVSILLSLCALLTHPLLGAPLILFVASSLLYKKFSSKIIPILHFLATALLLPILFTLNNLRVDAPFPNVTNPFSRIGDFFLLFTRPYWYANHSPLRFEILYEWEALIVPMAVLLCTSGLYIYIVKKQNDKFVIPSEAETEPRNLDRLPRSLHLGRDDKKNILLIYPATALGLCLSAWLLVSWIHFPDVVAYEQGDYPMRLIKASLIFLLPFGILGILEFRNFVISQFRNEEMRKLGNYGLALIASILLTLSLYFSYPQRNAKARFPGYNVTASHFKAV
ncbi:MAG: hypothetical protein AAB408_00005, partial [Patescibacteria group bacterium]